MAYQLSWSPSARLDLKDLASYIAESRPEAARRFVQSLFKTIEHLSDFPESGRMLPEFNDPNLREVIRKPFYSFTAESSNTGKDVSSSSSLVLKFPKPVLLRAARKSSSGN